MKVMVIVKASKASEAGEMPSQQLLTEMGKYNEELQKAGIMLDGAGLHPTSKGKRVRFAGRNRTVIDGPFTETKELIAGFCMIQAESWEEVMDWSRRFAAIQGSGECELRPLFEPSDFPEEVFPAEDAAREQALREELQRKAGKAATY